MITHYDCGLRLSSSRQYLRNFKNFKKLKTLLYPSLQILPFIGPIRRGEHGQWTFETILVFSFFPRLRGARRQLWFLWSALLPSGNPGIFPFKSFIYSSLSLYIFLRNSTEYVTMATKVLTPTNVSTSVSLPSSWPRHFQG